LAADNGPNYDNDDMGIKEKTYRNIISNKKVFDSSSSKLFKITANPTNDFECLGFPEESVYKYEAYMLEKMTTFSKQITIDIPSRYMIEDLIAKIDREN
jgi:hypothetical protein